MLLLPRRYVVLFLIPLFSDASFVVDGTIEFLMLLMNFC